MDTVVLDVNETLFTLDPVAAALDDVGIGAAHLDLWFAWILRDGFAAAASGTFAAFPDLARHQTEVLLAGATNVTDTASAVERVVAAFDEVTPAPDVERGLRRLAAADLRLVAFTNGSADITRRFLARAGLDDLVPIVHDASEAGMWKPAPDAYRWICDRVGTAPPDAVMLAVHPWDVAGAMRTGMHGAWLDRDHARWPSWLPTPDSSAGSLVELADALAARD